MNICEKSAPPASSDTGNVKPMAIGGRMVRERERLIGMSGEERAWRRQFVKDLEIKKARLVPELEDELTNPIRALYRAPLDKLFHALAPKLGVERAYAIRFYTGKFLICMGLIYGGAYLLKYNANDWTRKDGFRIIQSRVVCNPGDEGFPKLSDRIKPSDYASRGFKEYLESINEGKGSGGNDEC